MNTDYTEDPTLPELVVGGAPVTIEVTASVKHLCPHKDEADLGVLILVFETGDQTVELHSLRAWLDTLNGWTVDHEGYTAHVREVLQQVGVRVKRATTQWETSGMGVAVTA